MILNRCAGSHHLEVALQRHGRLGALGGHVLDRLGFVENDAMPPRLHQQFGFLLQQPITAYQQIEGSQLF